MEKQNQLRMKTSASDDVHYNVISQLGTLPAWHELSDSKLSLQLIFENP